MARSDVTPSPDAPDAVSVLVQRLVALGEEGMRSGVADDFDIDAFVDEAFSPPPA